MAAKEEKSEFNIRELAAQIKERWAVEWEDYMLRSRGKKKSFPDTARWDGGTDAMGRTFKSVWYKAAEFVKQHGLHFERYIAAQFEGWAGPPPDPTRLYSNTGLDKYKAHCHNLPTQIKKALELQHNQAQLDFFKKSTDNTDWKEIALQIIYDTATSLSALYRYCLAYEILGQIKQDSDGHNKFVKAMTDWYTPASKQYLKAPDLYDEIWEDRIPAKFKQSLGAWYE
jgi:hypothetical protein